MAADRTGAFQQGQSGGGWAASLLLPLALTTAAAAQPKPPVSDLSNGNRWFAEKSYSRALQSYEKALQSGTLSPDRRTEVEVRVSVVLARLQKWDRALATGLDFVRRHRGTVWEPRGLYWLGQIYHNTPHSGWRLGAKVVRGANPPKSNSAMPLPVDLSAQDFQNAREAFEAAHLLFPAYRARFHTEKDEIALNFDLARVLMRGEEGTPWAEKQKWLPPTDPFWKVDRRTPYAPQWPIPKRLMVLYEQIGALAQGEQAALGLFAKAVWLQGYQKQRAQASLQWNGRKYVRVPYPYQEARPVDILTTLLTRYPRSAVRDQAEYTRAVLIAQTGDLRAAERAFVRTLAERPHSRWATDTRAQLQEIRRRQLSLSTTLSARPGDKLRLSVTARNLGEVRFAAYPVRLEEALRQRKAQDADNEWNSFEEIFGKLSQARRFYGSRVAAWNLRIPASRDHIGRSVALPLALTRPGAYVVEARGEGVEAATLVLVSDLTLIQKMHRDGVLFYAAHAGTGKPAAGAALLVKQNWLENNASRSRVMQVTADADGMVAAPFLRGPHRDNFSVAALARTAENYALTGFASSYGNGDNERYRIYSRTDRSVYRPQQTVYYRQIVMERRGGGVQTFTQRPVRIRVYDPYRKLLHKAIATTSRFGTVNGHFTLPADATLGEYAVEVTLPKRREEPGWNDTGGKFRVEEYKKPEVEVIVTPEAVRVRPGQPTTAKVRAAYYFGGPVPNAQVTYRGYRNRFAQTYRFPQPYDFLYEKETGREDRENDYRNGTVAAEGTARTDASGEATLTFSTELKTKEDGESDWTYTIEADVRDASRRTVTGTGEVKATRHDVAVFLNNPRGYATQGDRVEVEVKTLNPSDRPVAVSGTAKVTRLPATPAEKERLISQEPLQTDSEGRATIRWITSGSGLFRIVFFTTDSAGERVKNELTVWVDGPELAHGRLLYRDLYLGIKSPTAREGQTAKVLLVTPAANCTVLLTREAGSEILDKRLVRVPGHSLEIEVPLTHRDVPNVHLSALLVRNGQVFEATQEIFVPPVQRFAAVTVQADRASYQPGEKATFRLQAQDWQGRPLHTELSVSVSDAALNYIQKDYGPDIRGFFYGNRRAMAIETNHSAGMYLAALQISRERLRRYTQHEWTIPEGMGHLYEWDRQPGRHGGFDDFGMRRDPFYVDWEMPVGNILQWQTVVIKRAARVYAMDTLPAMPLRNGLTLLDSSVSAGGSLEMGAGMSGEMVRKRASSRLAPPNVLSPAPKAFSSIETDPPDIVDGLARATLRTRFVDTAFWTPAVVTDAEGKATVEVVWPDNLTQWRANAVGCTEAAQVGSGETQITTRKDLLVRLQAPRFVVEGDTVTLSANVQNALPEDARVRVTLSLEGEATLAEGTENALWVEVPKNSEKRVDWSVLAGSEGVIRIQMAAQTTGAADAAEVVVPVIVHGVEKLTTQSGVLREKGTAQLAVTLPKERKPGLSEVVVQLNPSLAGVMLDALPYLADYPYGCMEQTLSRFVPCVVTAGTLKTLGYDLRDLQRRARRLAEQRQKEGQRPGSVANSPYTYPKGQPGRVDFSHQQVVQERAANPVFDARLLQKMADAGLLRIAQSQHVDGGWGWWPADATDPYMSATVCYGLQLARDAGYAVHPQVLGRGLHYLAGEFARGGELHLRVIQARTLAMTPGFRAIIRATVVEKLYPQRDRLSVYGKALLAWTLHQVGETKRAQVLLRNLESDVTVDKENGTASWDAGQSEWWRWYHNRAETNAAVLEAYLAIQPKSEMPERLVRWLVNNRRGGIWNSTQETAMVVYALTDYLRLHRELAADTTVSVNLADRIQRQYKITRENALFFDNRFVVPDELLTGESLPLTITKQGSGACYYTVITRAFSQEASIKGNGGEIAVRRRYFRLKPGAVLPQPESKPPDPQRPNPFLSGQYELLSRSGVQMGYRDMTDGPAYARELLADGAPLNTGDLIEVELELTSKNDYNYLIFEDIKPAGCEPVEVKSGEKANGSVVAYRELRDQKVAFFLSSLPQGTRTLTFRLRAETPGQFHALPASGYAMYAPDLRTLSDEQSLQITEPPLNVPGN